MKAIWRHQRRVARQLSARQSSLARPRPVGRLVSPLRTSSSPFSTSSRHCEALEAVGTVDPVEDIPAVVKTPKHEDLAVIRAQTRRLPMTCPGCGAPSQTVAPEDAGYYNLSRSGVRNHVRDGVKDEDKVMEQVLASADKSTLSTLGLADGVKSTKAEVQRQTPICDRCHNILHHSGTSSTPIFHPSIESIQDMIEDSPHTHNHIYHIIDAADFPLSLIPDLTSSLSLPRMRTQNRRSKTKFSRGRVAEVSFIITRSDLLAPLKDQVDGLMPYLRETLRDALGRSGEKVRLGNVNCVSSKRDWWTKQVKQNVWERGGAGWMVGKVNVGKSGFFQAVFPKGRGGDAKVPNLDNLRQRERVQHAREGVFSANQGDRDTETLSEGGPLADFPGSLADESPTTTSSIPEKSQYEDSDIDLFDQSLLPPPQKEVQYPLMPTVSSLPGTTASPIRIPYGNGKGELIDLPGIFRSSLEEHVRPEHRQDLVMRSRVVPEQHSVTRTQSLLLGGGLIRITPRSGGDVFLAYPFVPLEPHVTATAKAEATEQGERVPHIGSIVDSSVFASPSPRTDAADAQTQKSKMKSAGIFRLKWDVTRKRAGPLTDPTAAKLRPEALPFIVYSADILIEGVGWVEIVCQVRKRRKLPISAPSEPATGEKPVERKEATAAFKPSTDSATPASSTEALTTTAQPEEESKLAGELGSYKPMSRPDISSEEEFPTIEVFTPEGKFVGIRPPMGAWMLGGKKADLTTKGQSKGRPRRSMKSVRLSQQARSRD